MHDHTKKTVHQAHEPEQLQGGRAFVPAVDIVDRADEFLVLADIPGARAADIDIQFERGELTLRARVAERQSDTTAYKVREYGVGDFVRTFRIGEGVDPQRIAAEVQNGVLTLHVPKSAETRTRKIAVKPA